MCKILSNKKKLGRGKHTKENCFSCSGKEPSDWFNLMNVKRERPNRCPVEQFQGYIVGQYWDYFGYHKQSACKCADKDKKVFETDATAYPMQCPFEMGEMTGEYYGWVDKKLAILSFYLKGIVHLFPDEIEQDAIFNIQSFVLSMRATYWYLATGEKRSKQTEVLFSTYVTMNRRKESAMFSYAETMFKKKKTKNAWWETFLFHLADFYKRLGWTKFVSFNVVLTDHKKKREFDGLEAIHNHAISCLNEPLLLPHETKLPDQANRDLLVLLPEGTKCSCCERDLGGLSATWMLQTKVYRPLWVPETPEKPELLPDTVEALGDLMLVRQYGIPVVFEYPSVSERNNSEATSQWTLVSCARNTHCLVTVAKMQFEKIESSARLSINWLFKTQRCHGCLQFCYESHRCSSCRSVRYCSKDCLGEDWKGHEGSCKNFALEPTEAISTRKLEGKPRSAFFAKCIHYLMTSDPYFEYFAARWAHEGLTVDDLIVQPVKKEKEKPAKENSGSMKHKKKKKAKENPNASEKPAKQDVHETEKAEEETKLCTGNERKVEPPKEKLKDIKTTTSNSKKLANHPNNVSKTTHGDKKTNSPPITNDKEKHKIQGVQCAAKDSDQQCKDDKNSHAEEEIEEVIFQEKENGVKENKDAVYIRGRVGNSDMKMAALLQTEDINMEVGKVEEMLVRSGFDINNVKITTMKVTGKGLSGEECLEKVKQAIASESAPCKECSCKKEESHKEEIVKKEVKKYSMPEKTKEELHKESEVYSKKLDQFRKDVEKKHFEIRHIKTQGKAWMNGRICKVEDISGRKSRYDPRLICSIKGDEQDGMQYSLKPSTMVDCYVDVEDIDIYTCQSGVTYKKQQETNLCHTMALNFLARAMLWMEDQGHNQLHQKARWLPLLFVVNNP